MNLTVLEISRKLQKFGYRLTPQRMAVYNYLLDSPDHPSAEKIFDALKIPYPSLSLATVYNTLEMLTKLGFVNEMGPIGDGKCHYEARCEPHINLACISCQKIIDVPSENAARLMDDIGRSKGYEVLGTRILVYGYCSTCQEKQKKVNQK